MQYFLSDRQKFTSADILSGSPADHPLISSDTREDNYFTTFDNSADSLMMSGSSCPPPTNWAAGATTTVTGTTFYPISPVFGPSVVDETVTITSDRTVTKGAEIQGGLGWSIGVLEAQAHVKLDGSVTTHIGISQQFRIRKGMSVHMLAQIIYRQTVLHRTNYSGPNCQPFPQTLTVLTPINTAIVIGRANA